MKTKLLLLLLFLLPLAGETADIDLPFEEKRALYLTWHSDPTTTMTVFWITESKERETLLSISEEGSDQWQTVEGSLHQLPEGEDQFVLHRVDLTGLAPDTRYEIMQAGRRTLFSTLPSSLTRALQFVVGGDMFHRTPEKFTATCREAALTAPDFALLGGDIAYAAPRSPEHLDNFSRWLAFLVAWEKEMVTPDGRAIPLLAVIGDGETKGRENQPKENAPFFYALFGLEEGYSALDVGDYLTLIRLDSGHTNAVDGAQREWLEETLRCRYSTPHKVVIYHIPCYPSAHAFDYPLSVAVREAWVPLFEQYRISVAFEHHDHCYKRTHTLLNDAPHEEGILYLGDGGWGVDKPREPRSEHPYLSTSHSGLHFIKTTLFPDGTRLYEAIDQKGKRFDHYFDERCKPD